MIKKQPFLMGIATGLAPQILSNLNCTYDPDGYSNAPAISWTHQKSGTELQFGLRRRARDVTLSDMTSAGAGGTWTIWELCPVGDTLTLKWWHGAALHRALRKLMLSAANDAPGGTKYIAGPIDIDGFAARYPEHADLLRPHLYGLGGVDLGARPGSVPQVSRGHGESAADQTEQAGIYNPSDADCVADTEIAYTTLYPPGAP